MKKTSALTKAMVARIPEWVDKWIKIGLSTEPADFEKATAAALSAYDLCNLKRPKIILRMDSPYGANVGGVIVFNLLKEAGQVGSQVDSQVWSQVGSQVRSQVGSQVDSQVRSQVGSQVDSQVWSQVGSQVRSQVGSQVGSAIDNDRGGAFWSGWCAYISFLRDVYKWDDPVLEKFKIYEEIARSCGWVWWHENILAISNRPEWISRDDQGRLHNQTKHAIHYRDGWGFSAWHGVVIPDEWLGSPPSAKTAITWKNIEQRRAACEILGWASVLTELNARIIDTNADHQIGTLLEADIPDSGKERFLRVRCGTGREFVIPVPREIETARQGNAWTYGIDPSIFKPEVRT